MHNLQYFVEGLKDNTTIMLVIIAIVMDTIFGVIRAIKNRKFNSSFGIDGAIRKTSMLVSEVFLSIIDTMVAINLIGFIPKEIRDLLPTSIQIVGTATFFGLMYIAYETVSILKNMVLCGLPVKMIWEFVYKFLGKYTNELPDTDELIRKEKTKDEENNRCSKME